MFAAIVDNIKAIGGCVTAFGALCGGYVALDGPIPTSAKYVEQRVAYVLAENKKIESRVIDNQLQLNTVQRNLLRKEKFDRNLEIQKDPPPAVHSILKNRIDQIDDDLETIEKEREELRKEKVQK